MRVAVLGLGHMGRTVARRLCDTGHEVTVWNRTPGKAGDLVGLGVREAPAVVEAVRAGEVVLVLLTDDAAVRQVCLGSDGAIASLGKDAVLADMSTVHPDTSRELAEVVGERRFIDAPILGRPQTIAEGSAVLLLGGAEETVRRLDPLWNDLSSAHVYTGASGTASTLKLLSNVLLVGSTNLLSEAIVVAQAAGIPNDVLREVFDRSPMVAPATRVRIPDVLAGDHHGWWTLRLADKDLSLALSVASATNLAVPMTSTAADEIRRAIHAGYGDLDLGAVAELIRDRARES